MSNIKGDIFGGITAAVIALPLALAFGVASGMGAAAGLYGAIILGFIASFIGGTPSQISGPTGPMTVVLASSMTMFLGDINAIMSIILLAGILQVLFGVFKFGKFVRYIPYPVISGFMSGIGIIIIILQLNPFFGLASNGSVLETLYHLPSTILDTNLQALVLSVLTLLIMLLTPKKISAFIPTALIALVLMSFVSVYFSFDVDVIGEIPTSLPNLVFPSFEIERIKDILVLAITLALLGSIDTLLTSIVADSITKTKHRPNKELIGQGLGNCMVSLVGGIAGAGATMRTVINVKSGGNSKFSGMIHAVTLLLIMLFLAPIASQIPLAVLAGILMKVGIDILDYKFLRVIRNIPKNDLIVMIIVFTLTVFVDLIMAVGVGITLAALLIVYRISKEADIKINFLNSENHRLNKDVRVINIDGAFFFGSASYYEKQINSLLDTKKIVINCLNVPFMDISAIFTLEETIQRLHELDIKVALILKPSHLDKIQKVDSANILKNVKIYKSMDEALIHIRI